MAGGALTALTVLVSIKVTRGVPDHTHAVDVGSAPHRTRARIQQLENAQLIADALRTIREQADPMEREALLRELIDGISTDRIPGALRWLQTAGSDEAAAELSQRLARKWAELEPQVAAVWAERLPDSPARAGVLDQVAIAWANRKPDAAAAWARRLPEEEMHKALGSIARETLRTDPVKALQFSSEIPAGSAREGVILHATAEWVATDTGAAIAWARGIADDVLREQVLSAAATAWGNVDPAAAATLAATELPPGRAQDDAVVGIVQRWAQKDPERAAAWVGSFAEDDLRQTAMENLTSNSGFHKGR